MLCHPLGSAPLRLLRSSILLVSMPTFSLSTQNVDRFLGVRRQLNDQRWSAKHPRSIRRQLQPLRTGCRPLPQWSRCRRSSVDPWADRHPAALPRQGLVNVWTTIDWDWSPSASSPVADTLTYDFIYVKRDRALSRVRQHWWRHWWRNRTVRRGRERDDATDKLGIRFTLRGKSHHVTNREPNATTINDFASAIRLGQLYAMKQDAKMSQRCRATLHVI